MPPHSVDDYTEKTHARYLLEGLRVEAGLIILSDHEWNPTYEHGLEGRGDRQHGNLPW